MSAPSDDGAGVVATRVARTRKAAEGPAARRPKAGPCAPGHGARVARATRAEITDSDTHLNLYLETRPC
jgi:hypothetical protein